eukprot:4721531-Heterocapsa_arctica.AAC.1
MWSDRTASVGLRGQGAMTAARPMSSLPPSSTGSGTEAAEAGAAMAAGPPGRQAGGPSSRAVSLP